MTQTPTDGPVVIRAPRWAFFVLPLVPPALLLSVLGVLPAAERHIDTTHYLLLVAGFAAVLAALTRLAWWWSGADQVHANHAGLLISSRRRGDRQVAWTDVVELGWVAVAGPGDGGPAGRLRGGDRVVWLCQPPGPPRPSRIQALSALAERKRCALAPIPAGAGVRLRSTRPSKQ